ncbi:MAG: hypothetical protein KC519_15970, partial [Anaerolineae bacterium]|nr:hypothetical protein [Anaerolineae bacterium]
MPTRIEALHALETIMDNDQTLEFPVDPEHTGLRLAIILSFFGLAVVGFVIFSLVFSGDWAILNIILAIVLAYVTAMLIERLLKERWRSGRAVNLDPQSVKLVQKDAVETQINASGPIDVLTWRFEVKGRGRVPKGWWVVACGLAQDDRLLAVYTFMSPKRLETLSQATRERFKVLTSDKKARKTGDPLGADLRLAGEQRR